MTLKQPDLESFGFHGSTSNENVSYIAPMMNVQTDLSSQRIDNYRLSVTPT